MKEANVHDFLLPKFLRMSAIHGAKATKYKTPWYFLLDKGTHIIFYGWRIPRGVVILYTRFHDLGVIIKQNVTGGPIFSGFSTIYSRYP